MKKTLFFTVLLGVVLHLNAQTVIFEENFESVTPPDLPPNWISEDRDGNDASNWITFPSNISSFSGKVVVIISSSTTADHLLISPEINLVQGNAYSLEFMIAAANFTLVNPPDNHYAVYVLPSNIAFTGTETPVLEENISTGNMAVARTVNLSAFAGQKVNIYFRQFNPTSDEGLLLGLDNIKVIEGAMLGTVETSSISGVGIYPNPASEYVYLKSKSKITHAEIFDITGRKMDAQYSGSRIDVRNLQPGTYLIKITSGNETYSQKLIKK
ncbi:T9SS-dependent choice-of-anchor J family protein [Chryseobacterium gallinarum]|uniref:T9SS type A sorting domain-containing protein n=1 Tax=Chryseobacterium gallinarum TaxID=1324352 RepID=A0ABX6KMF2_CHRGL|nr:T9SS type A sorting domain-containing protein [Chryseobacterium gallinarum]QIY89812.1 T9SS type A sorting domain-containing protein [Chryseobacterium gallinarum]